MPQWCKDRYEAAHYKGFSQVAKDSGHYFPAVMPDCNKSSGLQLAIIKFILWEGFNADRTGTEGRMIKDKAGNYKRIHSSNRKGTSDISATIKGRSIKLEVKVGRDKPSADQLREQARERQAGGIYEFVYTFEEFITLYDQII
jgi:hypothetical protein